MLSPANGGKAERVAAYCRVSSDEQAQSGTIQNQTDFARRYADLHNLTILDTFLDEGVSGTVEPGKRSGARDMLAGAKAGRFNVLLVYRLDRLSRKLLHLLDTHRTLEECGVSIRSMTEPLDTSTAVGRFVFQLLGSIAELERETIKARVGLGRERALSEGKPLGRTPTGYTRDKAGLFVPHPTEADLVREMFDMAASGTSAGAIARSLNERGVLPMWGRRDYQSEKPKRGWWNHSSVLNILHNRVYWTGVYMYSRGGAAPARLEVPPLVDTALALRAQRRLELQNKEAKGPHRVYLLAGLIRCGECETNWVGSSTGPNPYYRCNGRKKTPDGKKKCSMPPVRADHLDRDAWNDLMAVAHDPALLFRKIGEKLAAGAAEVDSLRSELQLVEMQLQALLDQRLEAQLRADRGEMGRDELGPYLRAGMVRKGELERRRDELAERLASSQAEEARMATAEEVCRRLRDLVDEAEGDPELQRQILRGLVAEVTMERTEDGRAGAMVRYVASDPANPVADDGIPASSNCAPGDPVRGPRR